MDENAAEPEDISADIRAYIDAAVTEGMASADEDRVARLDRQLAQTVARLTEIIDAARRDSIERAPVQAGALRAELHAALATVDSRLAAIEGVQADALREAAAAAERVTARIDRLERETSEPATGLDTLRTEMRTELTERLSAVQADVAEETEDLIAMVGKDLTQRYDRLTRQVAAVSGSADSTDAALLRIDRELAQLRDSIEADRAALANQVTELKTSLAQRAEDLRAEVEERLGAMARQTRPAPAEPAVPGGGRRKARGTDVERLVESVEAWRAESVGEEEFAALRADMEKLVDRRIASARAEVQHRIEVLEALVANAGEDSGDGASLRQELRALQEQVAALRKTPAKAKGRSRDSG